MKLLVAEEDRPAIIPAGEDKDLARALLVILGLGAVVYVALGLTPSHYGMGFRVLGVDEGPLVGTARAIRSDEWIVLTPLFQIAVMGDFSTFNTVSPYRESLRGFWALPISDWSLVFKPQLWGFWLLPAGFAYSMYFAFMWTGFLAGYTIVLRQLGASLAVAATGAVILYFSHFVQVWWTSNAPTFAFAPWPLIVFLSPIRPVLKAPLLFWVSAVWVFGLVYPAFLIPAGFVLGVLLVAFRHDALTGANLAAGALAAAGLAAVFVAYYGDVLTVMTDTVYPGGRRVGGGGVPASKVLAHVFPFLTTVQFHPLIASPNECEVAVVSTLLPLSLLAFARYSSAGEALRPMARPILVVALALVAMLAWMTLPIPASWGAALLWTNVPPARMAWGFGLLFTLALLVCSSRLEYELSLRRFAAFSVTLLLAWLVSKIGFTELWPASEIAAKDALLASRFDLLPLATFGLFLALHASRPHFFATRANVVLMAAALTGFLTFGTFNPVQRAHAIFDVPNSAFQDEVREVADANPNGWAVLSGWYGALLNGVGIPSINHTLIAPQLEFFRAIFPALPEEEFNEAFNRYAHIVPREGAAVHSPQSDSVVVPLKAFSLPLKEVQAE